MGIWEEGTLEFQPRELISQRGAYPTAPGTLQKERRIQGAFSPPIPGFNHKKFWGRGRDWMAAEPLLSVVETLLSFFIPD